MTGYGRSPATNLEDTQPLPIVLEPQASGHAARCTRCGWTSRTYPVPDTAYSKGATHRCETN